jgi:alpha-amylase/alpha-mannosidase (GH57 family)
MRAARSAPPPVTILDRMALGKLRIVLLWHMHQPFYKDLVTGEYRMPWVRMHALKDYYGMVKLLEEFPGVHQNFNLVPSLVRQIEDYAAGTARDPLFDLAAKPAAELSPEDRRFALQNLFHAHVERMIGRYPRYRELFDRVKGTGRDAALDVNSFSNQDYTDLQVLSQIAWFDEFYLQQPEIRELVRKGRNFSRGDQELVMRRQVEIIRSILPAYAEAARTQRVELSATPYYHPILPLLCDTNAGAESSPGLQLPRVHFRHPEDAEQQIQLALEAHQKTFGVRPRGMWPSEGSVSDEVLAIASRNGIEWMATDEGVLGRSLGFAFNRDREGRLSPEGASRLYTIYRYSDGDAHMHLLFRDHRISDLIGFVYAGMSAADAANHLINSLRAAAEPVLRQGQDAVISIILDGENAWETYHESGREFLRRFYDSLQKDPQIEAVTISEAIARHPVKQFAELPRLTPGSWINANFNVWIGAREDNTAWDYLSEARDYYEANAHKVSEKMRQLAFDEVLIAEGSDWNWWYGPEHHSDSDSDFDELYRKHLSNVYNALGGVPPDYLARPISLSGLRPRIVPQTAFIRPRVDGYDINYFDWLGAAMYAADSRTGSMHGRQAFFESAYAGLDEANLYSRIDFAEALPEGELRLVIQCGTATGSVEAKGSAPEARRAPSEERVLRFEITVLDGKLKDWNVFDNSPAEIAKRALRSSKKTASSGTARASAKSPSGVEVALARILELKLPLSMLGATQGQTINLRFTLWRQGLPLDALPVDGSMDLEIASEDELANNVYNHSPVV